MKEDIVFVVKSHQRVGRFKEKTYNKVILHYGFDLSKVHVFVSTDEDLIAYTKAYPEIKIIQAPFGIVGVDNFITNYFNEGQKIIYMNDDVSMICEVSPDNKFTNVQQEELYRVVNTMFEIMVANDITYGGFYPVQNTMFMLGGKEVKLGLSLIMDPFSLTINNKKIVITIGDKSDFEKSILHYSDKGALLRYNRICFKAEYYGKVGGFQGRDSNTELQTAKDLMAKYPHHVASVNVKKEGKTSLKLKSLPPKKTIDVTSLCRESEVKQDIQQSLF